MYFCIGNTIITPINGIKSFGTLNPRWLPLNVAEITIFVNNTLRKDDQMVLLYKHIIVCYLNMVPWHTCIHIDINNNVFHNSLHMIKYLSHFQSNIGHNDSSMASHIYPDFIHRHTWYSECTSVLSSNSSLHQDCEFWKIDFLMLHYVTFTFYILKQCHFVLRLFVLWRYLVVWHRLVLLITTCLFMIHLINCKYIMIQ